MSLIETTSRELQELAKQMLVTKQNVSPYREFGTLVKAGSPEFPEYQSTVMLGELEVDGVKFVYFAS